MPDKQKRILVVDDAPETLEVLRRNLTSKGYLVFTAPGVDDALRVLECEAIDLVITDYKMPRVSGLDLVRHVRENYQDTEVMMITGYASIGGAVEAVKFGAEDYLAKPFTDEELFGAVEHALQKLVTRRISRLGTVLAASDTHGILGESRAIQEIFEFVDKAAGTPATVLITGESGTGKELVARAIHYRSPRVSAPFVPVNCGSIPEGLLESELFGHLKGAFTGAVETRAGFFQTADGGTIFLDEISETSLAMQVKLLRVLQDKEVCMVGDARTRKVDVRIVAATNKDLLNLVKKGQFRDDLFFRLSVITIAVPRLADRGDDVLMLAQHFADKFSRVMDKKPIRFSDGALRALKNYDWPGNVRELENVVQRLVVMTDGEVVNATDLPSLMRFSAPRQRGLKRTLAEVEKAHIQAVLESVGGNKTRAAEILGIDRKTLREKLKQDETR
ncbi:MAG: sigma-54-dependent Fis family transcriptional regulator [Candidatus Zixiibacteriota bacterium]|nr:MAG: sigma-54-dependent Fis family transcriptional regulator [candidate division Zixibacteria bacterium]